MRLRFEAQAMNSLLDTLKAEGYGVIGPRARDGAIVYEPVERADDLARGWRDEQQPGRYRLSPDERQVYFGFASSPHSWKAWLFPARERLFSATRNDAGDIAFIPEQDTAPQRAFIGVRACDASAIASQDRIFLEGPIADRSYSSRRKNSLIVAVECTSSAACCFCVSMRTGPNVRGGHDLALTEVSRNGRHYFLVHAGSNAGRRILERLGARIDLPNATPEEEQDAAALVEEAGKTQQRAIDPAAARVQLAAAFDDPAWDEIAARCVNCANCTLVCPTCFCSTMEDTADLRGNHAERWRRWDSCFTLDHSYLHGGSVRHSAKSRYRQWLTHKLSTWWDQFGTSGCVGCGRCITWCPVAIDLTQETNRIVRHEIH